MSTYLPGAIRTLGDATSFDATSDPTADPTAAELTAIAEAFHGAGAIQAVEPLGRGNVNLTYLVRSSTSLSVLQRLNRRVFERPDLVLNNLEVLSAHMAGKLGALQRRRWVLPRLLRTQTNRTSYRCPDGEVWRMLTYVEEARSVDVIESPSQARELGIGLGLFHQLVSDLPTAELADTLEGFHVTPRYLQDYHRALIQTRVQPSAQADHCIAFIREREAICDLLERARQRGELPVRPIHGDPKINNVMLDCRSGEAVALIDLDTVKPGLVHTDIGDCLRSGCNPLGEETLEIDAVHFDLELAGAILTGYFSQAGSLLSPREVQLIPDAARLISFELGLRFFSDHLNGNTYFRVSHPAHNLHRALVQFQLTASIESQMQELRQLVEDRAGASMSVKH